MPTVPNTYPLTSFILVPAERDAAMDAPEPIDMAPKLGVGAALLELVLLSLKLKLLLKRALT